MKITKEQLTEIRTKARKAAERLDATVIRRKNVAFDDKRTKRNRTRATQKKAALKDQS